MYTVNWFTKIIDVPISDLTLVSGTRYSLLMQDFLIEIRRLESGFMDGLWAPQILLHNNPKLDFAGADYAGFDEIFNGYEVAFDTLATRVDLIGSNNNIIDIMVVNGVSVVPGNSAGLQKVNIEGSSTGLTPEESEALLNIETDVDLIKTDISQIKSDIILIKSDINSIDGEVLLIKGDISSIDGNILTIQGDISSIDGNIVIIEGDISSIDGNMVTIQGDISSIDGNVGTIQGDISSIDGSVGTIEEDVLTIQTDINLLEGNVGTIQGDISSIDGNISTMEGNIATVQGDIVLIKSDIVDIESGISAIDGNIQTIELDISQIKSDIITINTDIGLMQIDVADIQVDMAFMRAIEEGDWEIISNQMIFYNALHIEIVRFNLFDIAGLPAQDNIYKREKI